MRLSVALVGASQIMMAHAALAQDASVAQQAASARPAPADDAAADPAMGDIIVTARRRAESLQDVPISITAVSGEMLATRGIRDALDLQYQTPSLSVTTNGASRNSVSYAIRGQRTQEVQLLADPPVGAYFAEVVAPRTYGFGTSFYDLQNVQVLKGVQGTLFGRNMTGGAVLVEPNHPDLNDYHASLTAQYGNYNMKDVTGMVNIPVIEDVFGLRVAARYRDRKGFTKDVSTGRDYDDQHYYAFRVSSELHLDRLTNYTVFDYLKQNEHGTALKFIGYALTDPANGEPTVIAQQIGASPFFPIAAGAPPQDVLGIFNRDLALGRYRFNSGGMGTPSNTLDGTLGQPFNKITNWGITNKTTFEVGDVTFKNIFGYRRIRYSNQTDYDGSGVALIAPLQFSRTSNISEEFQMQGTPLGSRLELTMGAFYFREKGQDGALPLSFAQLTSIGFASGDPSNAAFYLSRPAEAYRLSNIGYGLSASWAVYGAGTYTLTDALKLSAGIRYNNDVRKARVEPFSIALVGMPVCTFNGFGTLPMSACSQSRILKNEAATYDVTLQYEPSSDLTTYAALRHGYRAGGFSLRAQTEATFRPFQPEKVDEYEVGLKKTFIFDGGTRLSTNIAAFYQDYTNVQQQNAIVLNGQVQTVTTNIAARRNYGGEFEANLTLAGGLSANLFYSYVGTKVVKGDNGSYPLQGIPKHQLGGGLTYAREMDGVGTLNANVNATYRTKVPLDEYDAIAVQKGYALVNARVGLDHIGGSAFGAAVFVSNLTKAYYMQGGVMLISNGPTVNGVSPGGGPGFAASTFGEPRMFGIEASVKF
ncbi:TonB-dependent receptor [Sphingobium sp. HBC34]|uniref:TonB-dependent receptor n=1 Tax=Sphingobium cyanobacteriorum TaxID=3063954 RepID=A0ABT8ZP46_9SPHN|nr:TonB-dependent receptor [Sphingobium sp. HBC34]MDO7836310.1 TonB-dependent receptor [Sphingobium sp. HBC34]